MTTLGGIENFHQTGHRVVPHFVLQNGGKIPASSTLSLSYDSESVFSLFPRTSVRQTRGVGDNWSSETSRPGPTGPSGSFFRTLKVYSTDDWVLYSGVRVFYGTRTVGVDGRESFRSRRGEESGTVISPFNFKISPPSITRKVLLLNFREKGFLRIVVLSGMGPFDTVESKDYGFPL